MTDEQGKAFRELIRVAQVCAATARGLWFVTRIASQEESALKEIELQLEAAVDAANTALNAKGVEAGDSVATVH